MKISNITPVTGQICDVLRACGCAPAVTTDATGAEIIKVNAPPAVASAGGEK